MAKKLMVIDDEAGMTKVVEMIAQKLGFHTRSLNDPMQATEAFIAFKPDVLMLDMIMPGKDGIDVLHEILATGIPAMIVLTSGYGDSYLRLAEGVARFHQNVDVSVLHKPFRRRELEKLLADLVRTDHLTRARLAVRGDPEEQAERSASPCASTEVRRREQRTMRAIGLLAGGLAHDLNNLLAIVIGNLEVLAETNLHDSLITELVPDALDAALRGAELTRSLLSLARRRSQQPQRTDVNEVINGIARLLARALGEDITLELALAPGIWPIIVDRALLGASIINLARNARDAMPDGGRLTIATRNGPADASFAAMHPESTAGDHVVIEASDAGHGMPPEVLSRVFEPFFTTREPHKGRGLGLYMVSRFAKQAGGFITAHSEAGMGSTFRLCLPRSQPR